MQIMQVLPNLQQYSFTNSFLLFFDVSLHLASSGALIV